MMMTPGMVVLAVFLGGSSSLAFLANEKRSTKTVPAFTHTSTYEDGTCESYHGSVCANELILQQALVYVTANRSQADSEQFLAQNIARVRSEVPSSCQAYIIRAFCLGVLPRCSSQAYPGPIPVCREDCQNVFQHSCLMYLSRPLMQQFMDSVPLQCDNYPSVDSDSSTCMRLGSPGIGEQEPCFLRSQAFDKSFIKYVLKEHDLQNMCGSSYNTLRGFQSELSYRKVNDFIRRGMLSERTACISISFTEEDFMRLHCWPDILLDGRVHRSVGVFTKGRSSRSSAVIYVGWLETYSISSLRFLNFSLVTLLEDGHVTHRANAVWELCDLRMDVSLDVDTAGRTKLRTRQPVRLPTSFLDRMLLVPESEPPLMEAMRAVLGSYTHLVNTTISVVVAEEEVWIINGSLESKTAKNVRFHLVSLKDKASQKASILQLSFPLKEFQDRIPIKAGVLDSWILHHAESAAKLIDIKQLDAGLINDGQLLVPWKEVSRDFKRLMEDLDTTMGFYIRGVGGLSGCSGVAVGGAANDAARVCHTSSLIVTGNMRQHLMNITIKHQSREGYSDVLINSKIDSSLRTASSLTGCSVSVSKGHSRERSLHLSLANKFVGPFFFRLLSLRIQVLVGGKACLVYCSVLPPNRVSHVISLLINSFLATK